MRSFAVPVAGALAAAAATLAGPGSALQLHDLVGSLVPAPALPVVVVLFDGDAAGARETATRAGATRVWMALPSGDARLAGSEPDPGTLRAGADGRIRWDGGRRLPLPEALPGLLEVDAAQLGPGTPDTALAGREAVLVWSDAATGMREVAPAEQRPVDRGRLLAVALGAARADAGLSALPLGMAAAFVGVVALSWSEVLRRLLPARGLVWSAAAWVAIAGLCVAARIAGFDLPIGGLAGAVVLAAVVRLALSADRALATLDRVLLWLGAPPGDPGTKAGLGALVDMLAVHAPETRIVAWRRGPDGRPERVEEREGPGAMPALEAFPLTVVHGHGWEVRPVLDRGEPIGALGLAVPGEIPKDLSDLLGVFAKSRVGATPVAPEGGADPFAARLDLARVAVRRALWRAERWETLLGSSGSTMGVFDLAGALLTGSASMRAISGDGVRPPLLVALEALTPLDADALRSGVRAALADDSTTRFPSRALDTEVVISPIGARAERTAVLVQVHDVAAHRHLDQLKSTLLVATGFQARNALAAIGGFASMMAGEVRPERREQLAGRIAAQVERIGALITRGETLSATDASDSPAEPIYLQECVQSVVGNLEGARRDRLSLDLPAIAAPVAAQGPSLQRALVFLLVDVTESGHARVRLAPETEGLALEVEDDAGGLPEAMLAELVDIGNTTSGPAAARRLVEAMGGRFDAVGIPGVGTRYQIRLPYF